jgi:hypothetical protein
MQSIVSYVLFIAESQDKTVPVLNCDNSFIDIYSLIITPH